MASLCLNQMPARPTLPHEALELFRKDTAPKKANLTVGTYWDEKQRLYAFKTAKVARDRVRKRGYDHNYPRQGGSERFRQLITEFVLSGGSGNQHPAIVQNRATSYQTLGATGALHLAGQLLHDYLGCNTVYLSNPAWPCYQKIFNTAGLKDCRIYRYLKFGNSGDDSALDIEGLSEDLMSIPCGSVVVFQLCSHNPTASDPTPQEWRQIAAVAKQKGHRVILDAAYLGYVSGNPQQDVSDVIHIFVDEAQIDLLLTQSFSKNLGMYSDRMGALTVVLTNAEHLPMIDNAMHALIYSSYISPPAEPGLIIEEILSDGKLCARWRQELTEASARLYTNRRQFHDLLQALLPSKECWGPLLQQRGLFAYLSVDANMVERLRKEFSVYILPNGRLNISGLNPDNIEHVSRAVAAVMRGSNEM